MKLLKKNKGFTVVELVIVIGVIAVLSAILIPTFVNVTENAKKAAAQADCRTAYSAYALEAADDGMWTEGTYAGTKLANAKMEDVQLTREGKDYIYTAEKGWIAKPNTDARVFTYVAIELPSGTPSFSLADASVFEGITIQYVAA